MLNYYLDHCPQIMALETEGIELVEERAPEGGFGCHLIGRVRADVDVSFGEAGTEVFRYLACAGCYASGEVGDPACGGACDEEQGWGSCMCHTVNLRPCPCCGGKGYKEGRWEWQTARDLYHRAYAKQDSTVRMPDGSSKPLGQLPSEMPVLFLRFVGEHHPEWWSLRTM